jgi:3-methyladenine DNA glycosylase AlkD
VRPPGRPAMDAPALVDRLRSLGSSRNVAGQRRFGITPRTVQLGVPIPELRRIARSHRRDHALALSLWATGVHEARILAAHVDDPARVTGRQMEEWARGFDSWDECDQVCGNLFDRTYHAVAKARAWTRRRGEFAKRAGFVLMACLAAHRRDLPESVFLRFLPLIRREAGDGRNFVRKAANWALRVIGKRSPRLRRAAVAEARRIALQGSPSARWIASDALRELGK